MKELLACRSGRGRTKFVDLRSGDWFDSRLRRRPWIDNVGDWVPLDERDVPDGLRPQINENEIGITISDV